MNENELERLKQLYPYQFARVIDEWGMSVEPGWMTIFSETCAAIDAALTGHRKENFSWRQVKEKLGGLRMYWDRRWVEIDTNPYDFEIPNLARGDRPRRMERRLAEVATLSFDEDVSEEDINLAAAAAARELMLPETVTDQIRSIVENAVMQASTICQLCGQPGSHANIGGWLAVACEKHRNYDEFVAERARSAD